jgi:hypothetical protein
MVDWVSLIVATGLLSFSISGLCFFQYGRRKGALTALQTPELTHPSMSDITIIGKYTIPKMTTEKIAQLLKGPLASRGYSVNYLPNVLQIDNQMEPDEAKKKKNYFDKLHYYRNGYPNEMSIKIIATSDDSTFNEVEAICLPIMSRKMGQGYSFGFPKAHVEDAQRLCKDLMAQTMCILNAKVLVEPHIESSAKEPPTTEALYNTLTLDNINKKAHGILADAKMQIRLAGWVDREFLGDLEAANARGIDIRIVTKNADASDKLVKDDFGRLIKIFDKSVRVNSRFHDRFLICDNKVIIGSIYFVYASKTRYESAIFSEDQNIVNALKRQFDQIWEDPNSKIPQ